MLTKGDIHELAVAILAGLAISGIMHAWMIGRAMFGMPAALEELAREFREAKAVLIEVRTLLVTGAGNWKRRFDERG